MAKANLKIYPLFFFTKKQYGEFFHGLKKLEETTKTEIKYDFYERCFDITADKQESCLEAETLIIQRLLPRYNEQIDKNYLHGTFEDLSMINHASQEPQHTPTPTHALQQITLPGKPLDIHNADEHQYADDEDDNVNEGNDDTRSNTDLDTEYGSETVVVKTFNISPQIRSLEDFLIGPLQHNMQNADYMKLIPQMTGTACTLNGRSIKIEGAMDDVKEAYQKFAVIQKTYIGLSKKTLVPCLHFHSNRVFRVYYCHFSAYRYNSYVQHHYEKFEKPGDYHVVLPVFLDENTNEFGPPKDLIMGYSEPQPGRDYSRGASLNQPMRQSSDSGNALEKAMQLVQDAMRRSSINSIPSSSNSAVVDPNDSDCFQPPLWGLDRDFNTVYNTGDSEYIASDRLAQAFTPPPPVPTSKMSMLKDFPLLQTDLRRAASSSSSSSKQSTEYKPSLSIGNSPKRRVLRIVPQKASSGILSPSPSPIYFTDQINTIKNYNYNNIKTTLSKGLETVRGFKGEIKLYAKIGKVLWTVKSPEVNGRIWEYDQIIDIVMREYGTLPKFTNMTTKEERIINLLASEEIIRDAHCHSKTAIYEFHCSARNSPSLPYKPIVLHMNQGIIDVRKVVLGEQTVAEVDWVSLDRRYDFQLALTAKHLARCDVKPYTTFNKWVSVW
ncbi:unnamed protein product [Mucor circinelloides]